MSSLQLLKLAELGRNLLASRRKILVVATGCLFASGTMAYMYYQNQNRTNNPDRSDNVIDGENGKEKRERNSLDNKSTEKRGHTKGLKSLRILAAILLSRIDHIGMQKLYALVTRAGQGMLQTMHFDVSKIECSSQEDLENNKAGKSRKAREKCLHGSLMPESANESNVSNAEDLKIVEVPSKNSQKKESLGAQLNVETTDRKLIGHKAKEHGLQGSLIPASENKVGSNTVDLKIVEVPNKNPPKEKSIGAEVDIETMKRKLIGGGVAADALRVCTLCNIVCNSERVFNNHITGQKHAKMLKNQEAPGAVQSLKGDVCKIECTSQEVLESHNMGNKHKTKLKQLHDSLMPASESEPIVTNTEDLKITQVTKKRSRKRKGLVAQVDLKTTKNKLIGNYPLKVCALCDILCTSESVFNDHIAGQRHASMLKKQEFPNTG